MAWSLLSLSAPWLLDGEARETLPEPSSVLGTGGAVPRRASESKEVVGNPKVQLL